MNKNTDSKNVETVFRNNTLQKPALRLRDTNDLVTSPGTPENLLVVKSLKCIKCKNTVNEQESCYFIWQDMCFCDTLCLHWYQKQFLTISCSNCFTILSDENIGKYVFRFDQLLQFCSVPCFFEYQTKRKSCMYCMGKILSFSYKVNQHDPKYCSQDCVAKHLKAQGMSSIPLNSQSSCCLCKSSCLPITIQFQVGDELKDLCNQFCLQTFCFINHVKPVQCISCKTYFTPTSSTIKLTEENLIYQFCSKKCETFFVFSSLKVFPCAFCATKRFDTDLIKRCSRIEPLVYICSLECYIKKYSVPHQPQETFTAQNLVPKPRVPLSPIMENFPGEISTQEISTKAIIVKPNVNNIPAEKTLIKLPTQQKTCFIVKSKTFPEQKNAATMCSVQKADKSSCVKPKMFDQYVQTDLQDPKKVLVPVPVPIYVPAPMHMYSVPLPSPVPFPMPIPVPIFIPTTRKGTKRIFEDIKNIAEKIPSYAVEEGVLEIAEAVSLEATKELENSLAQSEQDVITMFSNGLLESVTDTNKTNHNTNSTKEIACNSSSGLSFQKAVGEKKKNVLETRLGVHAWRQWIRLTKSVVLADPENIDLLRFSAKELGSTLALFVNEVRRPNGKKYAPDTIFYLCLCIQKYLYENDRCDSIFFDMSYKDFLDTLDDEMKRFPLLFLDSAYIVTRIEEEHLWNSKQLGAHSPWVLLNTVLYHNMKYFKLMNIEENITMLITNIVKRRYGNDDSRSVLQYYTGGRFKEMPPNLENPEHCPLKLFEFYCSKLTVPVTKGTCYFEPESLCDVNNSVWYSNKPLETPALEIMFNRLRVVKELNTQTDMEEEE